MRFRIGLSSLVVLTFLVAGQSCVAKQAEAKAASTPQQDESEAKAPKIAPTKFLRLQTDEFQSPTALQTATARYVLTDESGNIKVDVVLEGVIHIADTSYFRGFQSRFQRYDMVLYESILKLESQQPEKSEFPTGLGMLQQLSTGTLGLAYQDDEIKYDAANMQRADLSAREIAKRMQERGDTGTTLFADLLTHLIQKMNQPPSTQTGSAQGDSAVPSAPVAAINPKELISVFTDPDGIMKIRRIMAMALVGSGLLESSLPPSIHKAIIGDRNDVAMAELRKGIAAGKKRIALFYGVGHMADFERRLVSELGMKRASVNYRNAWDLRDGAIEGAPLEGLIESTFRDSFKNKLRNFAKGLTNKKADEKKEAAKDQQIEDMEKSLEALKARLRELENEKKDDGSEKSGGDG